MKHNKRISKNDLMVFGLLVGVGLLVCLAIYVVNRRSPAAHVSTTAAPQAHTDDTTTHAGPASDTTPAPTVLPTDPARASTGTLGTPVGPTLNTHTISLSNSSTLMDSTCSGVTGATCSIVATKNGQSITVSDAKIVPASGVELIWDAKKLTAGTWEVRAVATQNGQTTQSQAESLVVTS